MSSVIPPAGGGGGAGEPTMLGSAVEEAKGLVPTPDVSGDDSPSSRMAKIEMEGEEVALGWKPPAHPPIPPEVQFLHVSRTIHELVTDRNRSVGIFLFVASLLIGASSAILNAPPEVPTIIPIAWLAKWCFPLTFGTLAIIGIFMCLILARTRVGLIYEVAKLNALMGLPPARVQRVSPLSIFYLMHLLVALLGGVSAGLCVGLIAGSGGWGALAYIVGIAIAAAYLALFVATYTLSVKGVKIEPPAAPAAAPTGRRS